MPSTKTVESFIAKQSQWKNALLSFRGILLKTDLEETIKWGAPVYTLNGKHVVGMGAFKSYVGLWFFQGVFLSDPKKVLINAQEGKTKALRQMRFSSYEEIDYKMIEAYIQEAIENQKAGKEMKPENNKKLVIPVELKSELKKDVDLQNSFDQLTLSKQREYADYISEAKQAATRQKRTEKALPLIRQKIGLNDKYR